MVSRLTDVLLLYGSQRRGHITKTMHIHSRREVTIKNHKYLTIKKLNAMKKSIVGTLALATMVVGMSAFRSADATAVKSADSIAITADSIAVDSLKSNDSLKAVPVEGGSITGKITPADGATEVEAVMGEEKVKGAISDGAFTIPSVKAGTYTVTVLGKSPYKNAEIKDVKVEDDKATDLGEIKLEQ
jgi:hypothetical protein